MGLNWGKTFWWSVVFTVIVYLLAGFGMAGGMSVVAPLFFSAYGIFIIFVAVWTSVAFCYVE